MNRNSNGAGEAADEAALAAERLDALQARLELLERDRDNRISDSAAELRARSGRMRELEDERNAALRAAIEARVRYEAADRELGEAREYGTTVERRRAAAADEVNELNSKLEGERAQTARLERCTAELELLKARSEAQVVALLKERKVISELASRAAASRAWRIGHALTSLGRRITFRKNRGTSALGRIQAQLDRPVLELPSPGPDRDADNRPG